jgi:hypothetical protein
MRTKAEGGTTFTVCDECYEQDKTRKQPVAFSARDNFFYAHGRTDGQNNSPYDSSAWLAKHAPPPDTHDTDELISAAYMRGREDGRAELKAEADLMAERLGYMNINMRAEQGCMSGACIVSWFKDDKYIRESE